MNIPREIGATGKPSAAQAKIDEHSWTVRFMSIPLEAAGRLHEPQPPAAIVTASGRRFKPRGAARAEVRRQ